MNGVQLETLVARALEGAVILSVAAASFLSRAGFEELRRAASCGETEQGAIVLLGHCAPCWTDALIAGVAAASIIAAAHALTSPGLMQAQKRR